MYCRQFLNRIFTPCVLITRNYPHFINRTRSSVSILRCFSHSLNMTAIPAKKQKIGTHDGVFHCDEALACFMLRQLPEYSDAAIMRTRDMQKLSECDIVVDVGAVYNASTHRYDHHQREFEENLSGLRPEMGDQWKIKLSSAGLIYVHFGEQVLNEILKQANVSLSKTDLQVIFRNVYKNFIQEIDAIDNGVEMFAGEPRYRITTNISSRVGRLNPEWNSSGNIDTDALFYKAMDLVGREFTDKVLYYGKVWWPARTLVKEALDNRFEIHKSGEIIEFIERFPWKEHLFELEKELKLENVTKYVIFMDKPDSWRVQGVPITPESFVCRKFLHEKWRGIRDDKLSEVSGIPESIFCHASGFIGGNKTREGALEMAVKSLES